MAALCDEMQAMMDRWVSLYVAGDIEGAVAAYAEDGEIHSPYGPPARGRDEIRATTEAWKATGETNKTVTVLRAWGDGALAGCIARYSGDYPAADGGMATESGISVNLARREAGGGWTILVSSLNSDTPPLAGAD